MAKSQVSTIGESTIDLGDEVVVCVRVRDLSGRCLAGAKVTIGGPHPAHGTTDRSGLVKLPVTMSGDLPVDARYVTSQLERGTAQFTAATRTIKATDLSFDEDGDGAAKAELWVTLRVDIRYVLTHAFGWQNPHLRKKVYFDAQSYKYTTLSNQHPTDDPSRDRALALADAVRYFKQRADAKVIQRLDAELKLVEARDDQEMAAADSVRSKHKIKDDSPNSPELQAEIDKAFAEAQKDETRKAIAALEADASGPHLTTHRGLVECLLDLFDKEPEGARTPDWVKYAVLHLSGLRYRPMGAGGTVPLYIAPAHVVLGFRKRDIRHTEHPSSWDRTGAPAGADASHEERQRGFAFEYAALIAREPELASLKRDGAAMYALAKDPANWEAKAKVSRSITALRAVAEKVAQIWIELASTSSKAGAMDADATFLGEIVDRWASPGPDQLPERVWLCTVKSTQLINDFIDPAWPPFTEIRWNIGTRTDDDEELEDELEKVYEDGHKGREERDAERRLEAERRAANDRAAVGSATDADRKAKEATAKANALRAAREEAAAKKKLAQEEERARKATDGAKTAAARHARSVEQRELEEWGLWSGDDSVNAARRWGPHFEATLQPYFNQVVCNDVLYILSTIRGAGLGGMIAEVSRAFKPPAVIGAPSGRGQFRPTEPGQVQAGDVLIQTQFVDYALASPHDVRVAFGKEAESAPQVSGPAELLERKGYGIESSTGILLVNERGKIKKLNWMHVATAIGSGVGTNDKGATGEGVFFFETASPVGISFRTFEEILDDRAWAFARPGPSKNEPDLKPFLDRARLLAGLDED